MLFEVNVSLLVLFAKLYSSQTILYSENYSLDQIE